MTHELVALERRCWSALTTGDAGDFYERVLTDTMMMVLPSMVLDRSEVLESWLAATPWRDFQLDDARVVSLGNGAALLTYRVTAYREREVAAYRAQCTSVYRRVTGRWRLAFQQQTPLGTNPLVTASVALS